VSEFTSSAVVTPTEDGKFDVTWPVVTARAKSGTIITGRPETVAALTGGAPPFASGEVVRTFETRAEADAQV